MGGHDSRAGVTGWMAFRSRHRDAGLVANPVRHDPASGPNADIIGRMAVRDIMENPFRPQPGRRPPCLAGRTAERNTLMQSARTLARGANGSERVIMAPRGYGKTALLTELRRGLAKDGPGLRVFSVRAADMRTDEDLLTTLSDPEGGRRAVRTGGGFTVSGLGGADKRHDVWVAAGAATRQLLSTAPTVLLIDEGSALRPDAAQTLLNAIEVLNGEQASVMLVIAGTPGVELALNNADASFWGRSGHTRLELLKPEASRAAVRKPLVDVGIEVDAEALRHVVETAHGYPHFLQLWGAALFDHAKRHSVAKLAPGDVEACAREFERGRDAMYATRIGELNRSGKAAAWGVAKAFRAAGADAEVSDAEIDRAIVRGLSAGGFSADRSDDERRRLASLGFFWEPDMSPAAGCRIGIPSLIDYTLEKLRGFGQDAPESSPDPRDHP